MSYSLKFKQDALKEWGKLDGNLRQLFKNKLKQRLANPRVPASRLSGQKDRYKIKLRKPGYRLVYEVRDAAGRVEYEADFYILRPTDPARGSRKILYDVTNRGRQYVHWMFGDSRTPRINDATFTTPGRLKFPAIPGVQVARRVNEIGVLKDWVKPEMDMSKPYRPLVTQVDADGNEIAGILLPEIAVPLATHTGWNYYRAPHPEGELCDRDGAYVPFAATRADREAKGDPRLSLEERYGDHAAYVKRFEQAANKLVTERLLLREDAERLIARARSAETVQRFTR